MNFDYEHVSLLNWAAMLVAVILAARLRVAGASVLVHHLGSHNKANPRHWRLAQWVSIATLTVHAGGYRAGHEPHHREPFATLADPDAALLHRLRFRPGTPYYLLWLRFWWTLVSPLFHAQLSLARLRGVFTQGPVKRRLAAWAFWVSLLVATGVAGVLKGVLLYFVLLLLAGNVSALLELVSEHIWFAEPSLDSRERHARLSHGRHLGVMPPEGHQRINPAAWALWLARTGFAAVLRFCVLPGDLPWHHAHHTGMPPTHRGHRPYWANAAHQYSQIFWQDRGQQRQAVATLGQAIGRWFHALAAMRG